MNGNNSPGPVLYEVRGPNKCASEECENYTIKSLHGMVKNRMVAHIVQISVLLFPLFVIQLLSSVSASNGK